MYKKTGSETQTLCLSYIHIPRMSVMALLGHASTVDHCDLNYLISDEVRGIRAGRFEDEPLISWRSLGLY